jgi:site-specific recombinase XerD
MQAEIEAFAAALGKASRAAQNTVVSYRRDLHDFRGFLLDRKAALGRDGSEIDPGSVSADHIRAYLANLMKVLRRSSVQRRLFAVKAFFRWRETFAGIPHCAPRAPSAGCRRFFPSETCAA